jgi:ParB family transcriptional regulator, chromosome partitioning protein
MNRIETLTAGGKKNVLGRGLGALIEEAEPESRGEKSISSGTDLDIDLIDSNPFQPRTAFDQEGLEELSMSIKELGLIQPVTVRKLAGARYQLISGERRLKAAKMAGLTRVPAYVRSADDQGMLELALVENIQREDLNAIEIALSYQRLMDECSLTQENLSARVGKKRSTVSNYIRLLKLPAEIQHGIREDKITMGHARALITMEDPAAQIDLFFRIIDEDLSVRRTETLANRKTTLKTTKTGQAETPVKPYEELTSQLSGFLKTQVELQRSNKGAGKIVIPFNSDDELERIIGIFDRLKA